MNKDSNFVLGQKVTYKCKYDPTLLVFVPRKEKRIEIGYNQGEVNFEGFDLWNAYEISYLLPSGKPQVKIGVLTYSSDTNNIVESKSLKLYFNSFNMENYKNDEQVINIIEKDLKKGLNDNGLKFRLFDIKSNINNPIGERGYFNIDDLNIQVFKYNVKKELLISTPIHYLGIDKDDNKLLCLSSNLLKSNCLITSQPDWGSIYIKYVPNELFVDADSLLKYIISFRQHDEFHEQCIERIFFDLFELLKPKALEVFGKYVRRGGLDINPYRIFDPKNLIRKEDFRNKLELAEFERDERQ